MTHSAITTHKSISPLIRRERLKEWLLYGVLVVIMFFLLVMASIVFVQSEQLELREKGIYRTEQELINGGKRFIDYFYSLNSATVQYDQYRALNMIIEPELHKKRKKYLETTDLVRKVINTRMKSGIVWNRTTSNVLEESTDYLKVEYKGVLKIESGKASRFHIILFLVPVLKDDENTDGTGVLRWIDRAVEPFKADDH